MKKMITVLLFSLICANAFAQPVTQAKMDSIDRIRIAYIAKYKDMAILEMYKSGIPASITLAQGLLESAAGTSFLVQSANNHFGMKCGSDWDSATFYKNDDEFTHDGQPVKSCFRSYTDPADNFSDHSDFLRDPQKHNRYGALFLLDPLDYVAWATGLQAAGYSPVGHYSARLIEYIERYHLHELDYKAWSNRSKMAAQHRTVAINTVQAVRAVEDETLAEIALSCGVDISKVVEYNENQWLPNTPLMHGTPIYLDERKYSWQASDLEFFFLHDGKTISEISQLFGIKEEALRRLNGLTSGQEPGMEAKVRISGQRQPNEKMTLATSRIKSPVAAKPKNKKPPMVPVKGAFLVNEANVSHLNSVLGSPIDGDWKQHNYATNDVSPANDENIEVTVGNVQFHDVSRGDTVVGLARKYSTTTEKIRRWNSLEQDKIQVGQRLRVK